MINNFQSPTPVGPPNPNDQNPVETSSEPTDQIGGMPLNMDLDKPKKKERSFKLWPGHLPKKQQIILAAFLVVVVGGIIGFFVYTQLFAKDSPIANNQPAPAGETPAAPTTVPSELTGEQVKPELNERPVTGVMIENSPDARPQSGLTQAGVVFEAVAEGGITRFLALYQEATPGRIGPVRSARPYYVHWAFGFDAAYGHVGGSPDAISLIRRLQIKDLDQFHNAQYYRRISERYAPHNMYTSMEDLDKAKKARDYNKSDFKGFTRKEKEEPAETPEVTRIDMTLSSMLYNVTWKYDKKTNTYARQMAGKSHKDEKSGKTITPKVVIALITSKGQDGKYSVYKTIGSGQAIVFQDGKRIVGKWTKERPSAPLVFTTKDGTPLDLNPGQTWITALGSTSEVKAK